MAVGPPRRLGVLLALLGLVLLAGGISLMVQGDNAYFVVIGLGTLAAGILIALGKLAGVWLYAGVFAVALFWSAAESGGKLAQLLPRVVVPAAICVYLFSARVRSRLS